MHAGVVFAGQSVHAPFRIASNLDREAVILVSVSKQTEKDFVIIVSFFFLPQCDQDRFELGVVVGVEPRIWSVAMLGNRPSTPEINSISGVSITVSVISRASPVCIDDEKVTSVTQVTIVIFFEQIGVVSPGHLRKNKCFAFSVRQY